MTNFERFFCFPQIISSDRLVRYHRLGDTWLGVMDPDRSSLHYIPSPFSDQLWTICLKFGKSATNFDSPLAESCPNGRRNDEPPKLPALFPSCMHCRLNCPEKGVRTLPRYSIAPMSSVEIIEFEAFRTEDQIRTLKILTLRL